MSAHPLEAVPPGSPSGGPHSAALVCAEVQPLLSPYADGVLGANRVQAIESHLAGCENCRRELQALKAEQALLVEALGDLRPSESYRGRVARMCVAVRQKAARMAESLPQRGWAILRWTVAFVAVALFTALCLTRGAPVRPDYEPPVEAFLRAASPLFWVNAGMLVVALLLMLEGRWLARLESYLGAHWGGRPERPPSRLGVVTLEMVGLLGVVATSIFHALFLAG